MNIVMNDWILDEKSLDKLQHYISVIPKKIVRGIANDDGLTFSIGDTTPRLTISIEQDD